MKTFLAALSIALLPAAAIAQSPLAIGSVAVSAPASVAVLDMGKLKGDPARLAWSPDLRRVYLQTIEGPFHQPRAIHHYLIDTSSGKASPVAGEPEWFAAYWAAKSDRSSPDTPGLSIDLTSENRQDKTTNVPRGGDLARGGTDPGTTGSSTGEAIAAAATSLTSVVHTMKLKGHEIGQFVNSVIVPGLTFAWAPAGARAIAYCEPKGGKLVLMNPEGKQQEIDGTKNTLLPMWSPDATKLAWLQETGRNRFELRVADLR